MSSPSLRTHSKYDPYKYHRRAWAASRKPKEPDTIYLGNADKPIVLDKSCLIGEKASHVAIFAPTRHGKTTLARSLVRPLCRWVKRDEATLYADFPKHEDYSRIRERSGPVSLDFQPLRYLQPLRAGRIQRQRILHWWDELLRVAGSLHRGWVTASLLVQKLQAYPQKNALALVLQEYGRLVRTLHILRWYANQEDRRRILRQLNKGEALHDLRAYLFIANKGQLRRRRGEELSHQASCLNLVTNAVITWNTVYMTAVVEQLKQEGYPMQESDLAHIWPTRHNHINVYGKYHFNIEEARGRKGLRPLRPPGGRG
jgi:hypothetical protein